MLRRVRVVAGEHFVWEVVGSPHEILLFQWWELLVLVFLVVVRHKIVVSVGHDQSVKDIQNENRQ